MTDQPLMAGWYLPHWTHRAGASIRFKIQCGVIGYQLVASDERRRPLNHWPSFTIRSAAHINDIAQNPEVAERLIQFAAQWALEGPR